MKITYCDICYQVIKPGDKKYVLAIHILTQKGNENKEETYEALQRNYQYYNKIEHHEVCVECKKVLEYFFHVRKEELRKIKKELDKLYKKKVGNS
jgi:hypothetical protein